MDGSPNEVGQISEVVDVILRYKTHSERMLLAISNLRKQSMIVRAHFTHKAKALRS